MIAGFGLATLCCSALGGRSFWGGRFLHMHQQQQLVFFSFSSLFAFQAWEQILQTEKSEFVSRQQKNQQQQKQNTSSFLFSYLVILFHIEEFPLETDTTSCSLLPLPHHIVAPCLMLHFAEEGGQVQHEQHRRRHQEA